MISKDQARALVVLAAQPRAGFNPATAVDDDTLDAALAAYVEACVAERLAATIDPSFSPIVVPGSWADCRDAEPKGDNGDKSNPDEPLRLGDRVRVKQSGRTGTLVRGSCATYRGAEDFIDTDGEVCVRLDGGTGVWYHDPSEVERA